MNGLHTVRIRDLDVRFRMDGPETAQVVMLAHGILTSHVMWDGVAELLAQRWRVLRYDLRGHGSTTVGQLPYAMSELALDAIALLDKLKIERVHFVGSSLGGMLGQWVGAHHSERIHSLTLANTTAVQSAPLAWEQRVNVAREAGLHPLVEPSLQRWFTPGFLRSNCPEVSKMRSIASATPVDGFIGCATVVKDLTQLHLLPRINAPTLVVAGEQDTATTPTEAQQIVANVCGAKLILLPAAHQTAVECSKAFTAAWTSFIDEIPHSSRS